MLDASSRGGEAAVLLTRAIAISGLPFGERANDRPAGDRAAGDRAAGDSSGDRAAPTEQGSASGEAYDWRPFRPGIEIVRLYTAPSGHSSALLRYAPGAKLARHSHIGFEHILVLSGTQIDDNGEHPAGTLLVHPPGTAHSVSTQTGCTVLAIWEKPVVFLD